MGFEVAQIRSLQGNAYLIKGDSIGLVDTLGRGELKWLCKGIEKNGVKVEDIDFILLTHHHTDHAANVAAIKERSGATLIAGASDAPIVDGSESTPAPSALNRLGRFLRKLPRALVDRAQDYRRVEVDRQVEGGELIEELGLEVIALPGHTPGGVGFLDREGRRAFIGDMMAYVFRKPKMPSLSFSESLDEVFKSQECLADLELETAYPGHGQIIEPGASGLIREFKNKKAKELRV